jgi:hypothetical protein
MPMVGGAISCISIGGGGVYNDFSRLPDFGGGIFLMARSSLRRCILCLFLLIILGCGEALAQTFQGSLTGTVTDPTGAVVPDAVVTIQEMDKGFSRSVTTQADGSYEIPLLPPGRYHLTAEKPGFRKFDRSSLPLLVNQHLREDITLTVGQLGEVLVVEASPITLETQTSSVGTTIDAQKVNEIPLNGRNFLELALLVPGVSPGTEGTHIASRGGAINVNGMRDSMNSYWLDGLDDTSVGVGQYTVAPPLDSVEEFRMETGVYEAKFGAHAGAEVNMVTKSGTNLVHGSLYEYARNTDFDARNFFDPSTAPMHRNQFGGTIGGPAVIPGVYDGRDRTFFFVAYEGTREHRDFYDNFLVPSMGERQGDFTDLLNPNCSSQTILLNPLALLQGQTQPFTNINQVLPQADPVGQALVNRYPQPNLANASCGAANYQALVNRQVSYDTLTGRIDHQFNSANSLFVRYNLNFDREFWPTGTVPELTTALPGYGRFSHDAYQMIGLDWTHIFNPKLVNELKMGYNRYQLREVDQDVGNNLAASLGISGIANIGTVPAGVPNLNFSGYAGMGADETTPQSGAVNTFQIGDTLTQVVGSHTLSYGADIRDVHRGNFSLDNVIRGEFDFTGFLTGGLDQVPAGAGAAFGCPNCTFGNSVADALLGLPQYWLNGFQEYISGQFGEYDFFAQDDWHVRPRLTMNLGLRYEYKSLVTEGSNGFSNFDFSNGDLMVAGAKAVTLEAVNPSTGLYAPVGTLNLGSTASNRSLQKPDRDNFAPRIGFAWQPFKGSQTVLRAGYGVFYDQTFGDVYFQKAANPPFAHLQEGNFDSALMNGLQPGTGAIIQDAFNPNITGTAYPAMSPFQLNFRNAFIQQWTADVQHQLGSTWLFDVAYVGTRGLRLVQETDPNQPVNLTSASAANAASTLAQCSAGACPQPYAPYPNFAYTQSSGSSIYHSLQVKVERRFSKGLSVLGSYTYSKSIDTSSGPFMDTRDANFPQNSYDVAAEKGLSDFNVPQRLSLAYLWAMPFGNSLVKTDNRPLNTVIRNWEVGSVLTVQSGSPFTPIVTGDISGADEFNNPTVQADTDRPNVASSHYYPSKKTPQEWVSPSAFSLPEQFTFGNSGRNILRGPGLGSCDFSVLRNFRLAESGKLQFRAEMFNIFNRANFDIPQRTVNSPSFGQIFNTLQPVAGLASGGPGEPRELQLGLWLVW